MNRDPRFQQLDHLIKRMVIIGGCEFSYEEKAPYVSSGKSILGALEVDSTGRGLKCHECGEWCWHLGVHVAKAHLMKASEYCWKHGLKLKTRLKHPSIPKRKCHEKFSEHRSIRACQTPSARSKARAHQSRKQHELANLRSRCAEQIKSRVKSMSKALGRAPTVRELSAVGICRATWQGQLDIRSMAQLLKESGVEHPPCAKTDKKVYTEEEKRSMLQMLRDAKSALGRTPVASDCRRPLLPSFNLFLKVFGSWANSLAASGIVKTTEACA